MIGHSVYITANSDDRINLIGRNLLQFNVVTEQGESVGRLNDVMWLPGSDVYVVHNGVKEFLIPIVPEVVREVNYENEYIMITPMDGLLD